MRLPRPAILLGIYPACVLLQFLLNTAVYGLEIWSMERLSVATGVAVLAIGLWKRERDFAPVSLVAGAVVGTIEMLGNAVSIPEMIRYARYDERRYAEADFYLHMAGSVVGLVAGVCALAAAITLAVHYRRDAALRPLFRALRTAVVIQAALLACIAWFGLGGMEYTPIHVALLVSQAPAVAILKPMGWCCGINGGLVFTDAMDPHWGPLTRIGIPILLVTNAGVLALLFLAMRALATRVWRRSRPVAQP